MSKVKGMRSKQPTTDQGLVLQSNFARVDCERCILGECEMNNKSVLQNTGSVIAKIGFRRRDAGLLEETVRAYGESD